MARFEPAANLDDILAKAAQPEFVDVAKNIRSRAARNVNDLTGAYAEKSLRVFNDDRGVGTETTDFAGHIIEWGGGNTAAQAPIRRAADSVGRFKEA